MFTRRLGDVKVEVRWRYVGVFFAVVVALGCAALHKNLPQTPKFASRLGGLRAFLRAYPRPFPRSYSQRHSVNYKHANIAQADANLMAAEQPSSHGVALNNALRYRLFCQRLKSWADGDERLLSEVGCGGLCK